MKHEIDIQEQYICDECGYSSPVANERCPDCGSTMTSLNDDTSKKGKGKSENDEDYDEEMDSGATSSLEDLQSKEQEESDEDYKKDTFGEDQ